MSEGQKMTLSVRRIVTRRLMVALTQFHPLSTQENKRLSRPLMFTSSLEHAFRKIPAREEKAAENLSLSLIVFVMSISEAFFFYFLLHDQNKYFFVA